MTAAPGPGGSAPRPTATATRGRASCARTPRGGRSASRAGSTAAATTAGWCSSTCATAAGSSSSCSTPTTRRTAHAAAHALRSEHVISAAATVARRDPANVNPKLATGEVELRVTDLDRLADARTPPFPVDEDGPVDELLRLRHRVIDIRRTRTRRALQLRHTITSAMRGRARRRGLRRGRDARCSRARRPRARATSSSRRAWQPGAFYALPQSPQLFKQLLMVAGLERYYQFVRCFRDEDQRADRQLEFTQLDLEMSFVERGRRDRAHRARARGGVPRPPASTSPPRRGGGCPTTRRCCATAATRPTPASGSRSRDLGDALASSEFRVFARRAGVRRRGARAQRGRARAPALGARRADRVRPALWRQGPGVGVRPGGRRRGARRSRSSSPTRSARP